MQALQGNGRRALKSMYARDITLAVIIKLALLVALMVLFNRAALRPDNGPTATAGAVVGVALDGGSSR